MAIDRVFNTPTVTIDQERYEELIKHEKQYEQYRQVADDDIRDIIETKRDIEPVKEREEK